MKTNKTGNSVEEDDLRFSFRQCQVDKEQIAKHWRRIQREISEQEEKKDTDKEAE